MDDKKRADIIFIIFAIICVSFALMMALSVVEMVFSVYESITLSLRDPCLPRG